MNPAGRTDSPANLKAMGSKLDGRVLQLVEESRAWEKVYG